MVTTINEDGSRYFVHAADVQGVFTQLRRFAGVGLVAIYIALPLVPINGAPAVFLDIFHRRIHLFGLTFLFQELWLLFFAITGIGFLLFFITALLGRIWCGWACPQTVFLEVVFRRIERLIEGDALTRRKWDEAPWNPGKIFRRFFKNGVFIFLSAVIAHVFLSYFVSIPALYQMTRLSPLENWGTFLFVAALTGLLYFNFTWFREQFCIVLCPYGRFQSALIDENSIVVGYDAKRGEPRGRASLQDVGDCVDCRRCVQVCPTGIDIRQGLQIECISCASCIDACNEVMTRLGRPKGLIRHDSLNSFAGKATRILRPRIFIYLVLMVVGLSAFSFAAMQVKPVTLSALRMQGAPYYKDGDLVRNNFMLRLANKHSEAHQYTISITSPFPTLQVAGTHAIKTDLGGGEEITEPLILSMPLSDFRGQFDARILVHNEIGEIEIEKTIPFLGPFRE